MKAKKSNNRGCYANCGRVALHTNRLNEGRNGKHASAVELSKNSKVGPASATYVSQQSCPKSCVFLKEGLSEGPTPKDLAIEEAYAIDTLTGRFDLRLKVVGDSATNEAASIVGDAVKRFKERSKRYGSERAAWAYTHSWHPDKENVRRESFGPISVLASCQSEDEVELANSLGYAAALVVDKMPGKVVKIDDKSYVHCLEQSKGTQCVDCRLCFDDEFLKEKNITIVFELHGSAVKARQSIFKIYGNTATL